MSYKKAKIEAFTNNVEPNKDAPIIAHIRRHFAESLGWTRQLQNPLIVDAFAKVPREAFLEPGPWLVYFPELGYIPTPSDDPRHVYQNVRIALDPERILNNGEPGLTASVMDFATPSREETVVHIGCGAGYFTAIWSAIVGEEGSVTGIEIDSWLSEKAKKNLSSYKNVEVICGNGSFAELPDADIIVMSAGSNTIQRSWLERLKPGGRLLVPFTLSSRWGRLLKVTRKETTFEAKFMPSESITYYELAGSRTAILEEQIEASLAKYSWDFEGQIVLTDSKPNENVWLYDSEQGLAITVDNFQEAA